MPYVANTGSQGAGGPVASTQMAQKFQDFVLNAGVNNQTDAILMRGAPRVLAFVRQTAGAVAGSVRLQTSISNIDNGVGLPALEWITIGVQTLTPLNTNITLDEVIPGKFVRLLINAPGANAITLSVAIMAAQ